jgi:hypothetical protein
VVGDPVVGVVVGPDLLRALAASDLRAARRRELLLLALALQLEQARTEHAQSLLLVLELRLLVLHCHHQPGREVGDPDCGVRRIDALPAWAGGAVDVHLEVVRVDLDVDLLSLRHDRDRRRGGVDTPLRLGRGHALDTVGAALPLEDRVRALALHRKGGLVVTARLARIRPEHLGAEPAPLRVAGEHAEEVARPDGPFVTARALADLDDDVFHVVRVALDQRELQLFLELAQALFELRHEVAQLAVSAGRLQVLLRGPPVLRELVGAFELLHAPAGLRGRLPVGEDGRIGHALLRVRIGPLQLGDQFVDRSHGR